MELALLAPACIYSIVTTEPVQTRSDTISYPFAETSPVWIGTIGSTDPESRKTAANRLLGALEVAYQLLKTGYGDHPIPLLEAHFQDAREKLEEIAGSSREP